MPSPNPATRREHVGAAAATTLSTSMSSIDTTFTLTSATNWPTGATGSFFVVIDPGTGTEEKVLCASRSTTTVTVAGSGRGADNTVAQSHTSGAVCYPCWTATEADELNAHANASTDIHGITGALASASALAAKQAAGNYITALTGDVTAAGPGSAASTLATVNANVGSFGTASSVMTQTVNAKGLTTAAASVPIVIAESAVTNLTTDLAALQPLDADLTALAAMTSTVGLVARTGAGAFTQRTITSSDGSLTVSNGNGSANPSLVLTDPGVVTTTGFTAAAGWTLSSGTYHLIAGAIVFLHVVCTRTGATLTGSGSGNITDTDLLSAYPAAARPNRDLRALYIVGNTAFGTCTVAAAGTVQLETLVPTATIASGDTVSVDFTYLLAS